MQRLLNGRAAACSYGRLLELRFRAQRWAAENVRECLSDCDGAGMLRIDRPDGAEFLVPCPLMTRECPRGVEFVREAERRAALMMPPDVPKRFRREVAQARETLALHSARLWDGKGFLYIHGDTGTGKSFAAAWRIYHDILAAIGRYWDNPQVWGRMGRSKARWFSAYSVCIDKANFYEAQGAAFLVLDDLGCETKTPANCAALNELVSVRYNGMLPTVITSNCDLYELEHRYMQRMYERIIHSNHVVNAGTENMRLEE